MLLRVIFLLFHRACHDSTEKGFEQDELDILLPSRNIFLQRSLSLSSGLCRDFIKAFLSLESFHWLNLEAVEFSAGLESPVKVNMTQFRALSAFSY